MSRSLVHLLNTFAVRFEADHAPAKIVDTIKLFAKEYTVRRAEHRDRTAEEDRRIERQRTLFVMLPPSDATDRLKQAMLQRAYDLLWDGDAFGCDAILEFLPSDDVVKMLDAWSDDAEDNGGPKSHWHGRAA